MTNPNDVELSEEQIKLAVEAGVRILSYAPNTTKRLCDKLLKRGYTRETAAAAAKILIEKGLLDDRRELDGAVYCAAKKLLGPKRIPAELMRFGFEKELISEVNYEKLGIDFIENCRRLLQKRGGIVDLKTKAFLRSKGFTDDIIRAASEDDE